jgi:glutamate-1-semialdehyde 2,1-aminomutase
MNSPKSLNSQELFARSLKVAPGGVHSPVRAFKSVGGTPQFFKSAKGAFLQGVEGTQFIDFCQSFGPLILGHLDDEVLEVVHETVDLAWSFGACEPYSLELAEWITSRLPWVDKLRFVSSGTEAVMSAVRVARGFTQKNKILKFSGCYHGHVDSLLVKAGSGLAGLASSDSAGVSESTARETLVAQLDDEKSFLEVVMQNKNDLAAVIIEPLPANYGLLLQRKEFIQKIAEVCRQNSVLLIFDEVISGFRVAMGGMAEVLGIHPDLVTYGKVIGGGFPVGCYGGRKDIMDFVAPNGPVYQAGTLSANPVGMRAGLATLQKVEREKVHHILEQRTSKFTQELEKLLCQYVGPMKVIHQGSIFWMHADSGQVIRKFEDISKDHAEKFKKIFHSALNQGIYLAPSGFEVGFLGFAHTENILGETLDKMKVALQNL